MYKDGDEEGILHLLTKAFGGWPRHNIDTSVLDHWLWKYPENPLSENIISLCLDGKKIIGCQHTWQMNIKIGNNIYKAARSCDSAVDSDYRRMGIYTKMKKNQEEIMEKSNIKFHFGVSLNPILLQRAKKIGRRPFPYEVHKFVKIYDMKKVIEYMGDINSTKIIGYNILEFLNNVKMMFMRKNLLNNIDVRVIDRFDDQIDSFWDDVKSHYSFSVEKRMNYMNWRYCHQKGMTYKVFAAYRDGVLLGYLVSFINYSDKGRPVGYIVDCLSRQESPEAVFQLLEKSLAHFESHNVIMVDWRIIVGHLNSRIAENFGILDTRSQALFGYDPNPKVLAEDMALLQKRIKGRIHFTYDVCDYI